MANPNTAQFPGQIPDDFGLTVASDDFFTTIPVGIGSGDTLFAVNNINFNYPCLVLIDSEVMRVDSAAGGNFTVVQRGYLGTTPASHAAGSTVFGYIFSYHHNQVAAEIKAICAVLGVGGVNFISTGTSLGGDLSGTLPDPTVVSINGETALIIPTIVDYKAGVSQGGVAALGVNTPSSNPAVGADSGNTNTIFGVAQFASGESDGIQDHFYITSDQIGAIDVEIIWRAAATTGNVQWNVSTAFCSHSGAITDPSFNSAQSVTTTVAGTTEQTNSSVVSGLTLTGLSKPGLMFWKLTRTNGGADTLSGTVEIVEIIFTVRRSISY
jgi:hypothetical protein